MFGYRDLDVDEVRTNRTERLKSRTLPSLIWIESFIQTKREATLMIYISDSIIKQPAGSLDLAEARRGIDQYFALSE